jgi:hypothetical protein
MAPGSGEPERPHGGSRASGAGLPAPCAYASRAPPLAGPRLSLVRQVDVAPTLARILDVEIAADGRPIGGLLAPGVGAGTVGQPAGSRSK